VVVLGISDRSEQFAIRIAASIDKSSTTEIRVVFKHSIIGIRAETFVVGDCFG